MASAMDETSVQVVSTSRVNACRSPRCAARTSASIAMLVPEAHPLSPLAMKTPRPSHSLTLARLRRREKCLHRLVEKRRIVQHDEVPGLESNDCPVTRNASDLTFVRLLH